MTDRKQLAEWVLDDGLEDESLESVRSALRIPTADRPFQLQRAFAADIPAEDIADLTRIDRWFIDQLAELAEESRAFTALETVDAAALLRMKQFGFGDAELAAFRGTTEAEIRDARLENGIRPVFRTVDTCAGEFPAATPYLYSTYEVENESERSERRNVLG